MFNNTAQQCLSDWLTHNNNYEDKSTSTRIAVNRELRLLTSGYDNNERDLTSRYQQTAKTYTRQYISTKVYKYICSIQNE